MICYKCGEKLDDDARFCKYCGAKLNNENLSAIKEENKADVTKKEEPKPQNNKKFKPQMNVGKGLGALVLISILLIATLFLSFFGGPTGDNIKKTNVDGLTVTYRYDYKVFDDETLIQKRYEGTDKDGNKIDVSVSIRYEGRFKGKIDKKYKEANESNVGVISLNGTINSQQVSDGLGQRIIGDIDEALYEKYTAIFDEVKGSGLIVKFVDNDKSYLCVNEELLILLIALTCFELVAIAVYVLNILRNKKIEKDEYGERDANIQYKVGIGVLIASLISLIASVALGFLNLTYTLILFALTIFLGAVGKGLIKQGVLTKILKIVLTLMTIVLIPLSIIFFLFVIL